MAIKARKLHHATRQIIEKCSMQLFQHPDIPRMGKTTEFGVIPFKQAAFQQLICFGLQHGAWSVLEICYQHLFMELAPQPPFALPLSRIELFRLRSVPKRRSDPRLTHLSS